MKFKTRTHISYKTCIAVGIKIVVTISIIAALGYTDKIQHDLYWVKMDRLADDFGNNVARSHWQWRAYDKKERIILVNYNSAGQEVNRRPITMSRVGWPRVEPTSRGCSEVFYNVLGEQQDVDGFKVKAEFLDGIKLNGKILDTCCKFSTVNGLGFRYRIFTGEVSELSN